MYASPFDFSTVSFGRKILMDASRRVEGEGRNFCALNRMGQPPTLRARE
jgi:hypothetical protein